MPAVEALSQILGSILVALLHNVLQNEGREEKGKSLLYHTAEGYRGTSECSEWLDADRRECGRPSNILRATNRKIMFMLMLRWHMVGCIHCAILSPLPYMYMHAHCSSSLPGKKLSSRPPSPPSKSSRDTTSEAGSGKP